MQLYGKCSPLTKDLMKMISEDIAGLPPSMKEQRLDESGVDGESVWMAESSERENDALALVQPSSERLPQIRQFNKDAGKRPILLVNPQWKERDDPLDALSRKGGFLGAIGNFMGGKAALQAELYEDIGFIDVY